MTQSESTVRWAHLPKEVKQVIRATGWRPRPHKCYENSQHFLFLCEDLFPDLYRRLEYREGYVFDPKIEQKFHHGWLALDGQTLDLSIRSDQYEYREFQSYTFEQLYQNTKTRANRGHYGAMQGYQSVFGGAI